MSRAFIGSATVVVLAATVAAFPAPRMTEGPPPGFTGGFGEESCVVCHTGNDVNAFGGSVVLRGLPDAYEGGREYVLEVVLAAEETDVAGFQLTARFAEGAPKGRNAGTLRPVDGRTEVTDSAGISYLHQSRAGSVTGDRGGSRWSIGWVPPASGGPVTIHVAANSGNADSSPLGDLVYTHAAVVRPAR